MLEKKLIKPNKMMIGVSEISEMLGVKISTIYAWVHSRQIPHYKVGRLVKFKVSEIEQWVSERKVEVFNLEA